MHADAPPCALVAATGSVRDQQAAFFIGGSCELADPSYVAVPRGHKGRVLNKYGYVTTTSGTVKVRWRRAFACARAHVHVCASVLL